MGLGGVVVAVGRDSKALAKLIQDENKNRIRVTFADFADLASVARAAQDVLEQVSQIDVLVNNSGIFYSIEDSDSNVLQFQLSSQQNHDFVVSDQLVKSLFVDRTSFSICIHGSDCFHYIKVLMVCQPHPN